MMSSCVTDSCAVSGLHPLGQIPVRDSTAPLGVCETDHPSTVCTAPYVGVVKRIAMATIAAAKDLIARSIEIKATRPNYQVNRRVPRPPEDGRWTCVRLNAMLDVTRR